MAPTPIGAGLVTPQFEVHFDTPLENLEPGEYLVIADIQYSERTGVPRYRYSSWDGSKAGILISLTFAADQSFFAIPNGIINNRFWLGSYEDPSIYMVDLLTGETLQFTTGTNCIFSRHFGVRDDRFIYMCSEKPDYRKSYYIVSLQTWEITGSPPVPEKMEFTGWMNSDTAEFSSWWESSMSEFPYCLSQAPFWELDCRTLPFFVRRLSPNGKWRWVKLARYRAEDYAGPFPIGVMPSECLQENAQACEPTQVHLPTEWQGIVLSDSSVVNWSPDSSNLMVFNFNCHGKDRNTWIWYYDVERRVSQIVTKFNYCIFDDIIWSNETDRFAINYGDPPFRPRIILVEEPFASYNLPITGYVIGTITIP